MAKAGPCFYTYLACATLKVACFRVNWTFSNTAPLYFVLFLYIAKLQVCKRKANEPFMHGNKI